MGTHGTCKARIIVAGVLLLLVAVTVLTLTACGGSGTPASSSPPSSAPSEAAITPSPVVWTPTPAAPVPKNGAPFEQVARLFAYDASEPIGLKDTGTYEYKYRGEPRTLRKIAYLSAGKPVEAWLTLPKGEGPFPAVMLLPGYGGSMPEGWAMYATDLVAKGYAALLIQPPNERTDGPRFTFFSWDAKQDVAANAQYVVDLRRGIDLLQSLPQIDGRRIGFIGHSYGGAVGGWLAGVEDRVKTYVLVSAGGGGWGEAVPMDQETRNAHSLMGNPPPGDAAIARWNRQTAFMAPMNFIGHNQGAAFLILNSTGDVPPGDRSARAAISRYGAAAPRPATVRYWGGTHNPDDRAYRIMTKFLRENL